MPRIETLVETSIYVDDLQQARQFYEGVLGLRVLRWEANRHVFFQAGPASVLLAFLPHSTLRGETLPAHGAQGPGHFALGIPRDELELWRAHLQAHDVAIEQEVQWPAGGRSLYFRDPSGNSVELLTRGVWELPSGW
jgi:catechol 2,3-dioxygenase-like lactoylglutathione lyase family enzyme